LVDAYNRATLADFSTETTPDFDAFLRMATGEKICLAFSSLFPPAAVLVLIERPMEAAEGGGPALPTAAEVYELEAPGLLEAVQRAAGDYFPFDWLFPSSTD
jgi:hypothetical protein